MTARVLIAALALAPACGQEPRQAPTPEAPCGDGAEPVRIADFCLRYYEARCEAETRCERFGDRPTVYDDCAAWAEAHGQVCEETWVALAARGDTSYDPAEAGRCVECARGLECATLHAVDGIHPSCVRDVFAGAALMDASCRDDVACIRRLACDLSEGCPGSCSDPSGPSRGQRTGARCGPDVGLCGLGLYCTEAGRCAPYSLRGQACGEGGGECDAATLWCNAFPDEGDVAVCDGLPGPGEDCGDVGGTSAPFCSGSVCDPDVGKCLLVKEVGERCTTNDQCRTGNCEASMTCGPVLAPEPSCAP